MNGLLFDIRKSLEDLDAGLKGSLNMTDAMETVASNLSLNQVPALWAKYPSKKSLADWFADLLLRVQQLSEWSEELILPKSLWLPGLFNPMSFLTAIMQTTSRTEGLPLDGICLKTDVTNYREPVDIPGPAEAGAFSHGFFLEGAGWELGRGDEQGYLTD